MNKRSVLLFVLLSCLGFSCRKAIELGDMIADIDNPTPYVLKYYSYDAPSTNGQNFSFTYNSQHKVSEIRHIVWGSMREEPNGAWEHWYDTSYYSIEYSNGLCTKVLDDDGYYSMYEYNEKKWPVKRSLYYPDSAIGAYEYFNYDSLGNLTKIINATSSGEPTFKRVFVYNIDNNRVSETDSALYDPQQHWRYEWVGFDDKVNFCKTINGLPAAIASDFVQVLSYSPNNATGLNVYRITDFSQPLPTPEFWEYTYKYNEEGLPTEFRWGSFIGTMEYEKYK